MSDAQPSLNDLKPILRQYWQFENFRPLQGEIIQSVLAGLDTLALLPTGGGKSLCYQLPALARPGLCLVISPLVALMKDQADHLRRKGITAFFLHGGMSRKEIVQTLQVAGSSNCKLLYISPERLGTELFLEWLPSLAVNLVAVDEAHCISQWGYDFRPSYLQIATLRGELPSVPMLALTASATPDVLTDISARLELRGPAIFKGSFSRPNLSYSVLDPGSSSGGSSGTPGTSETPGTSGHPGPPGAQGPLGTSGTLGTLGSRIAGILRKVPGSAIVYCRTRKETGLISDYLNRHGIGASAYHAGLPGEERVKRQEDWIKDRVPVIVSTNAFGMGIDKASVRTVIHTGPPDSPEAYYQEAGRAGRDGKKAFAVLLCGEEDVRRLEELPDRRFPSIEEVRDVFQDLMNFLQLPEGCGKEQSYDFDVAVFAGRFGLDMTLVLNVIRVLEQVGLVSFQQAFYMASKVSFTTGKENLYDFEREFPALGEMIEALLRNYEGIFDLPVAIREGKLASLLRKPPAKVKAELAQLEAYHLIEYQAQKDRPQLYFIRDRPPVSSLYIDPVDYGERKERYAERVRAMIRYLQSPGECRSRWLANYFGDVEAGRCGVCDQCLKKYTR